MKATETSQKVAVLLTISSWNDVLTELAFDDHELVARRASDSDENVLVNSCLSWVDQVDETVRDVRTRWRLFPPKRWAMMKMLKIRLPEYDELKDSVQRLHRLWYRDRPGILKK